MCVSFDIGYVLSDISDDGRTASVVQRDTSQEYQLFLPPVSEQELCERVRQRVPTSSAYVYNGCLAWYNVLLITLFI